MTTFRLGAPVALFVGLVVVYNANLRQVSSLDTYASRFVPIGLLRYGELTLDRFFPDLAGHPGDGYISTYLYRADGHLHDSHPPVGALLATPIYAIPVWLGRPRDVETAANVLSKLSASILTAGAAMLLLTTIGRLGDALDLGPRPARRPAAMAAVVAVFLGTSAWSTASQALWTHTAAVFGYALALWGIVAGWSGLAGIAAGAAAVSRPATAPAAILLLAFVTHRAWSRRAAGPPGRQAVQHALTGVAGLAVAAGAGLVYNLYVFGRVGGGAAGRTANWLEYFGATSMLSGSLPVGLAGLTVSPSRGALVFSPILLLAVSGAVRVWRSPPPRIGDEVARDVWWLGRYITVAIATTVAIYAKYLVWWGGHGFGPRYLTDVMPLAGVLIAIALMAPPAPDIRLRRTVWKLGVAALCVYSIGIQAIGAFCWPSPWTLRTDPPAVDRLWDWRANQIVSCLQAGPRIDPLARAMLDRLGFDQLGPN